MTTAEINECGFRTGPSPDEVRQKFSLRLLECWDEHKAEWEKLTPDRLIDCAEEIAVAHQLANDLPDMLNQGEMEYLLRFEDPLAVATDLWRGSIYTEIGEQEFREVLFESRERGDPEAAYELTEAAAKTAKAKNAVQPKRRPQER